MGKLVYEETIHEPLTPYGSDIYDLNFSDDGTGLLLTAFAGDLGTARNVEFRISDSATFQTQYAHGMAPADFVTADFGDITLELSAARISQALSVTSSETGENTILTSYNNGQASDTISAVGITTTDATFLISTLPNSSGLSVFQQQGDGSLSLISSALGASMGQISDISTVKAYGTTWVVGSSLTNDGVESFSFGNEGALTHISSFGASDGLGINTPVSLNMFVLSGQPYAVIGSAETSSLSVLRLEADGSFTATDHVLDDLATRFDQTTLVETLQIGDNVFVLATGSDDGFSLFQIRPDGKLHHLDTIVDTNGTTLDNISAAAMVVDGSDLRIFLSSGTETGLTHFSYDLSGRGDNFIGSSVDDTQFGTSQDDIILGNGGNDTLSGGSGDDIIIDGGGTDILVGGLGADVFTLDPDGTDDTILDFQRGKDALDLSFYPLLYDTDDLGYTRTSFGARLTFQGEVLNIYSNDGNSLSLAELSTINPFNVNRPALVLSTDEGPFGDGQTQIGNDADNTLVGTNGDDLLSGNFGNDILIGGAGADKLYGGLGFDTSSYITSASGMLLDLKDFSLNTSDAEGDTYSSIEAISGTGFADQIFGNSNGNTFYGNNGNDQLFGRAGDDRLEGGTGDDILTGGAGKDQMVGGDGSDTASFAGADQGVRIDLPNEFRNTGQAAGDQFQSIENLTGTSHADKIYGNPDANILKGNSGNDWISGRAGNDTLIGGGGNDYLDGGAEADVLDGGSGIDLASYSASKQGLTVDLSNNAINTGNASGDSYSSIENILGSRFDDFIIGDNGANLLLGNSGSDTLEGAGGDDILRGGRGDDRLTGGEGNDTLDGGFGSDVFVFIEGFGNDRIQEFCIFEDKLEIDLDLLADTSANASAVIAEFGHTDGSNVIFEFGDDSFIIEGVSDLSSLIDSMAFG